MVEASLTRLLAAVFLAVSGHRDDRRVLETLFEPQPPGHFISVHAGQPEIEQHNVGPQQAGGLDGRLPVVDSTRLVAESSQKCREGAGEIDVVIDDEYAISVRGSDSGVVGGHGRGDRFFFFARGKGDDKLAPFARSLARGGYRPPCISARALTMVSPMPSPPSVRASERSPCVNSSKTCGKQVLAGSPARCRGY